MTKRFHIPMLLAALLLGSAGGIRAEEGPGDCLGIEFDAQRPIRVAKVSKGESHAHLIKSAYDDSNCPAAAEACRMRAYLVLGDLVLVGKTKDAFTCIAFEPPTGKTVRWTRGWLPSARLEPVTPVASPKLADWIGRWTHPGGEITIARQSGGKLSAKGLAVIPAAQDTHTGVIEATARPSGGVLAFADAGEPFESEDADCRVRMQRIGPYLLVEDNGGCGGSAVSFTGLYARKH